MSASALGLAQLSECTVCLDEKPLQDSVAIHNHALIEHQHRVCRVCLPQLQQLKCPTCRSDLNQPFLIQQGADHPAFAVVHHPLQPAAHHHFQNQNVNFVDEIRNMIIHKFLNTSSETLATSFGSYFGYITIAQKAILPSVAYPYAAAMIGFYTLRLAFNWYTGKQGLVNGLYEMANNLLVGFGIGLMVACIQIATYSYLDAFLRYTLNYSSKLEFAKNTLATLCTEYNLPLASEIQVFGDQFSAKWPIGSISLDQLKSTFPNASYLLSSIKINNFFGFPVFKLAHTFTFNFEGWVAPAFQSLKALDMTLLSTLEGLFFGGMISALKNDAFLDND